jgi:hypothetical protein
MMTMKKVFKIAAASILAMGVVASAHATDANGTVSATVVAPIILSAPAAVDLGQVLQGATATDTTTADVTASSGTANVSLAGETGTCVNTDVSFDVQPVNATIDGTGAADTQTWNLSVTVGATAAEGATDCNYTISANYI